MDRREFLQQMGVGIGGLAAAQPATTALAADALASPPAEPVRGRLLRPVPYAVVQRSGFEPRRAHAHEPGGPRLGLADVAVEAEFPERPPESEWQFRTVALDQAFGQVRDWTKFEPRWDGARLTATLNIPAGGWFRLELRAVRGDQALAAASVEPCGVGDVLVIAGQSYAEGANDELLRVDDPPGRVVAFHPREKTWRIAHDPQPLVNNGGTIWPALGNLLCPVARVPIGFANVAVGGTASRQWLPGEALYDNLLAAGQALGRFRAVLWQQGESDVIERVATAQYVAHLRKIRETLAEAWGWSPPWLLAKSTMHPTVYQRPEEEARIRAAIDELCTLPGFRPGADTDILDGPHRGGIGTRQHFTGLGQRRAALLWFAAVWHELYTS